MKPSVYPVRDWKISNRKYKEAYNKYVISEDKFKNKDNKSKQLTICKTYFVK